MNDQTRHDRSLLPLEILGLIDRICNRFESDWESGGRPRIEDYLDQIAQAYRSALLGDLLAVELDARHRRGESPQVSEYLERFPSDAATIVGAFAVKPVQEPGDSGTEACIRRLDSGSLRDTDVGSTRPADADGRSAGSFTLGVVTGDGERFRVLRPHARGGLGAVFVALDLELHREVALKQILDRHADDPVSRSRFLLEAEITGGLEHPGIVPVYGLGTYDGGRPFYAMRFIKGDSLKEAIDRFHGNTALKADPGLRSLELRKLLRRFTDVCNAIDYAHSRGVLHRDIKPANIIVGKHGETLVVDWGLAKATGKAEPGTEELTLVPFSASGSAETLPGSALGTPAYMSPEQARGDLEHLGPRSDVYALGATLYYLLTGRPALEGDDVGDLMRRAQRGEFPTPRHHDATIDRALEAVCLKAMAREPDNRYGSCRALAEDIERWLADEPVSAWPEPFSRRAQRWARRNRTAVWAAAAAVLVPLAGTATVLGVQTRANRDLQAANTQTRQERDLARQNFELARRAVDDCLTRVGQNALLKEQGFHDLRQELLESALRYYQDFLRQRSDEPGLRAETALAHERLGNILDELDRYADALAEFDQALALIEPLAGRRPTDPAIATAQIRLEADRLQVLLASGQYVEALTAFDRTSKLGEAQLAAHGRTEELTFIMARTFTTAAGLLRVTQKAEDGVRVSRKAHEFAEQAVGGHPGDLAAARTYLEASWQTAELLWVTGRLDEARQVCLRSIPFGESLLRDHPRDFEIRRLLAALNLDLSAFEHLRGRLFECLKLNRKAADIAGALAREYPMSIRARLMWGATLADLSCQESQVDLHAEAEQSARTSIEVYEGVSREVPSNSYFRHRTALSRGFLGRAQFRAGKHVEALPTIQNAVTTLETSEDPLLKYATACLLALTSAITDPGEGPAGADRRRRDADRAISTLRRAIELGWAGVSDMKTETDLDPLRGRADFQAILMDLSFPADPFAR
jgi:serine/threonine-protein kinase